MNLGGEKCRACGAPLVWVRSAAGKYVPLDPPQHDGIDLAEVPGLKGLHPEVLGYDDGGNVRRISKAPLDTEGVWATVRVTHFATCPQRDRFRRRQHNLRLKR